MADAYPDYGERMSDPSCRPSERVAAERREYGVDHAVIGGVLLRRWRLPQVIAQAVELHHSPDADGEAAISALADGLTRYELGEVVQPGGARGRPRPRVGHRHGGSSSRSCTGCPTGASGAGAR